MVVVFIIIELNFNVRRSFGIFAHLPGDILLTSTQGLIIKASPPALPKREGAEV